MRNTNLEVVTALEKLSVIAIAVRTCALDHLSKMDNILTSELIPLHCSVL